MISAEQLRVSRDDLCWLLDVLYRPSEGGMPRRGSSPIVDSILDSIEDAAKTIEELAENLLEFAEDAGVPDTYLTTDSRLIAARKVLKR